MRSIVIVSLLTILGCQSAQPEPQAAKPRTSKAKSETLTYSYTWPDADPPDEADQYLSVIWNFNGVPYRKEQVSPGKWQWVVDEETVKFTEQAARHRHELLDALVSRVLTAQEMAEVGRKGSRLLIEYGTPYNQQENELRFQTMLLTQQVIRAGAACGGGDRERNVPSRRGDAGSETK